MHRQSAGAKPFATEGDWWRFSQYQIEDGCIRPAPGARLEWYDPWPGFKSGRSLTVGQSPGATQPLYQSLMKLAGQMEYRPGQKRYPDCLTGQSQQLILDWCAQHGLLGILLSRWEAIELQPERDDQLRVWRQRSYFRGFGQVVQMHETSGDTAEKQSPRVLLHGLNDQTLVQERPSQTWSRFFPTVNFSTRDDFSYPVPYSTEFCDLYGERLIDFCSAAKLFTDAVKNALSRTSIPNVAREQALDTLNLFRRSVSSVLYTEGGRIQARRIAPSLLASFADMAAQDLTYGLQVLQCTCCGSWFVSDAYQALYCSVACRLRYQKRRLRKQMKQAMLLRLQGRTLTDIAKELGQSRRIIKGWVEKSKT